MLIKVKCPKCGSEDLECSNEESKEGCVWIALFGVVYVFWLLIKWCVGSLVFVSYDIWAYLIKKRKGEGHLWRCIRFFSMAKRSYYCRSCGNYFKY